MKRMSATTINNLTSLLYLLDWFKNNFDEQLIENFLIEEKSNVNYTKLIIDNIFKTFYPREYNDRIERCSTK